MILSLFSGFLFFFFCKMHDKRRDFSDCNSSLQNRLVFSHLYLADTRADSSFPCSSAQRLRKIFPQFPQPKSVTGWGRVGAWREARNPWLRREAAPWNGETGAVRDTPVSPRPLKQGVFREPCTTRSLTNTSPCREREGFKAPQDSHSHGGFLLTWCGNSLADLSEGSHSKTSSSLGASESISRVSSAYARAALCMLARIGTILSALKNSSMLCLLMFLVYLSSHLPGMA